MKLIMSNGECLIDEENYERVSEFKWYIASHGYVRRTSDKMYLHRFLTDCPKEKQVDHINRNRLDNRISNLRICTQLENNKNIGKRKESTSKYKGVCKSKNNWSVTVEGNHIGIYENEEDAALIFDREIKKLNCDFSYLNGVYDDGREIKTVLQSKKTSKHKGVYLRSDKKKWVAQVRLNRKSKYIGSFDTQEEAIEAQELFLSKHS